MCLQDFIIWTAGGDKNGIHASLKESGEKVRGIIHPDVGTAYDVIMFDSASQPMHSSTYPCSCLSSTLVMYCGVQFWGLFA